jgi:oxygen-dependent protoporphyrinogen oxidase
VAVVGAGIAGLAAAWEIRGDAEVTIFDPDHVGGRIRTAVFDGHLVDEGADAFLTRVPEALRLCEEAGIATELVAPVATRALLWSGGRLRPFPPGLVLGVPRQLAGVLLSGILSPLGAARAAGDLVLPRGRPPATLTVRELVAGRFGAEVADRLVDPLVGGIHAGSTAVLGAAEVTPMLVAAAERSRSLMLGLRNTQAPDGSALFAAPRDGLGRLVDAVVDGLERHGVRLVPDRVVKVGTALADRVAVWPDPEPYDGAVVATPAAAASRLLGGSGPQDLARIRTASVVVVTMSFDETLAPEDCSGFLVPRSEGRLLTACSFGSSKWPHWAVEGRSVVRLSAGRDGDAAALALAEPELVGRLVDELGEALRRRVAPREVRVSRWPDAFPQYSLGHGSRVAGIEAAVQARLPTVALAGASYHGSGIPACIASGRRAARAVVERARARAGTASSSQPPRPARDISPRPEAP